MCKEKVATATGTLPPHQYSFSLMVILQGELEVIGTGNALYEIVQVRYGARRITDREETSDYVPPGPHLLINASPSLISIKAFACRECRVCCSVRSQIYPSVEPINPCNFIRYRLIYGACLGRTLQIAGDCYTRRRGAEVTEGKRGKHPTIILPLSMFHLVDFLTLSQVADHILKLVFS